MQDGAVARPPPSCVPGSLQGRCCSGRGDPEFTERRERAFENRKAERAYAQLVLPYPCRLDSMQGAIGQAHNLGATAAPCHSPIPRDRALAADTFVPQGDAQDQDTGGEEEDADREAGRRRPLQHRAARPAALFRTAQSPLAPTISPRRGRGSTSHHRTLLPPATGEDESHASGRAQEDDVRDQGARRSLPPFACRPTSRLRAHTTPRRCCPALLLQAAFKAMYAAYCSTASPPPGRNNAVCEHKMLKRLYSV